MDVVVVDVVAQNKCYTYIDKNGTHVTMCHCKYGGLSEAHSS